MWYKLKLAEVGCNGLWNGMASASDVEQLCAKSSLWVWGTTAEVPLLCELTAEGAQVWPVSDREHISFDAPESMSVNFKGGGSFIVKSFKVTGISSSMDSIDDDHLWADANSQSASDTTSESDDEDSAITSK